MKKISHFLWNILGIRIRLIPLVIGCGMIVMTVKIKSIYEEWNFIEVAYASEKKEPKEKTLDSTTKTPPPKPTPIEPLDISAEEYGVLKAMANQKRRPHPSTSIENRKSPLSEEVLKDLFNEIKKEKESLLAAEKRLKSLEKKEEQENDEQLERLVKVAENMKPEKSAKILEGVEFSTLLTIMKRLSPGKVSAILVQMAPEKASYLMTELAPKKK